MASLNKVMLIGHLGRDPETRYTNDGTAVCNFSLATTEKWKDKAGEKQERTEWHRITCWGKLAEIAAEYLTKGRQVYVEGSIRTSKFTDKDGVERESKDVTCQQLTLLGNKGDSGGSGAEGTKNQSASRPVEKPVAGSSTGGFDDSIPF